MQVSTCMLSSCQLTLQSVTVKVSSKQLHLGVYFSFNNDSISPNASTEPNRAHLQLHKRLDGIQPNLELQLTVPAPPSAIS